MKYFSTTQVLRPFIDFSKVPPGALAYAADRGTRVHHLCLDLYAKGIPVLNFSEDCKGYVDSFINWFDEYVSEVLFIEKQFIEKRFHYTGRVDLVCLLRDGRLAIVDLKTPAVESKSWALQMAAYRVMVNRSFQVDDNKKPAIMIPAKNGCMSLRLKKDGSRAIASVYQYSDNDFVLFLSALNVYRHFNS